MLLPLTAFQALSFGSLALATREGLQLKSQPWPCCDNIQSVYKLIKMINVECSCRVVVRLIVRGVCLYGMKQCDVYVFVLELAAIGVLTT